MKDKPRLLLICAVVVGIIIALLTSATWPFAVISVVLLTLLLPLTGTILGSAVARLCISVMATLTIYQIESVIFRLVHLHVNGSIYILLTVAAVVIAWLLLRQRHCTSKLIFSGLDLVFILPAVIITGLYVSRIILPSGDNATAIVRSITLASDDASHLSMFDTLLRSDSNLVSFTNSTQNEVTQQGGYPVGWHVASSIIASSVSPSLKNQTMLTVAVAYFIAKMASFFLVVIALTLFIYQMAHKLLSIKRKEFITHAALYALVAFCVFFVALPQAFEGFFSFLPILIYMYLFATVAIEFTLAKNKQTPLLAGLLLIFAVGSAFCWILTAPVLVATFAIIALSRYRSLRKIPSWFYAGIAVVALATIYQVLALLYTNSNSLNAIAYSGGITVPAFTIFILTNIVLFGALSLKRLQPIIQPLVAVITPLYCLMAPILFYISLKSQTITYYFQKLEIIALAILLPLTGVVLYFGISYLKLLPQKSLNSFYRLLIFGVILCMTIPSVIGYDCFVSIVNRTHHYSLDNQDANVLVTRILNHPFNELPIRPVFYYPDSQPRTILGSNIARMGFHNSQCANGLTNDVGYSSFDIFVNDIKTCAPKLPTIVIYTDPAGKQALSQSLDSSLIKSGEVKLELTSH